MAKFPTVKVPTLDEAFQRRTGFTSTKGESIVNIPLEKLEIIENQFWNRYSDTELENLALDIKENKVRQPAIVLPIENNKYRIYDGRNRFLASQKAGAQSLPSIIYASEEEAEKAFVSNNLLQRNKTAIEISEGYKRWREQLGLSINEIAEKEGVDRKQISRSLKLAELPRLFKDLVNEDVITQEGARFLYDKSKEAGDNEVKRNGVYTDVHSYLAKKGLLNSKISTSEFKGIVEVLTNSGADISSKPKRKVPKYNIPKEALSKWIPEDVNNESALKLIIAAFEEIDEMSLSEK